MQITQSKYAKRHKLSSLFPIELSSKINNTHSHTYNTSQGHREFPFGNSREFPGIADPRIPGGNSREFLKFWRELREISPVLSFSNFFCDYDILVFNLTAFWAKPWMTSLTQFFVFIEFRYTFKYWYRKITEQRQNFANSDRRYTNEDAEIILIGHRPSFCIHRRGMEGVLRKMF